MQKDSSGHTGKSHEIKEFEINATPWALILPADVKAEVLQNGAYRSLRTGLEFRIEESLYQKAVCLLLPAVVSLLGTYSEVKMIISSPGILFPAAAGIAGSILKNKATEIIGSYYYLVALAFGILLFFVNREHFVAYSLGYVTGHFLKLLYDYGRRRFYRIIPVNGKKITAYCLIEKRKN